MMFHIKKSLENRQELKERLVIFSIFMTFFIFILLQHSVVYFYHDDFGYASLSYGHIPEGVKPGLEYKLSHIIEFLKWQYNNWGGRILFFLIGIIVLKGGLWVFRILQSIVITMTYFLIYKICVFLSGNELSFKNKTICALVSCFSYGLLPIYVLRESVYWPTSSFVYMWPILFLFLGIYIYLKIENSSRLGLYLLFVCFSIFVASFSNEVISIITVTLFTTIFLYKKFFKKQKSIKELIIFASSILGSLLLFIAPGNVKRFLYHHPANTSLFSGIINTVKGMFFNYFNDEMLLIYLLSIIVLYFSINNNKTLNIHPWCKKIFKLLLGLIFIYFFMFEVLGGRFFPNRLNLIFLVVFFLIFFILTLFLFFERIYLVFLFFSASLSQAFLFVLGGFPPRASLPFLMIFTLLIIILVNISIHNSSISGKLKSRVIYSLLFLIFASLSMLKFGKTFLGYHQNSSVNEKNIKILNLAKKHSSNLAIINLLKLKDDFYAELMPYQKGGEHIEYWIKFYYALPQNILIKWNEYDEVLLHMDEDEFIFRR